jgi:hypothetical protein
MAGCDSEGPASVCAGRATNQTGTPAAAAPVQRVLRTVYLPSANADALQLKVESLQAQLQEQKQFAAERLEAMKQDRELREQVPSLDLFTCTRQ